MNIQGLFTRRETIELSGATSNQLQYLERSGLIVPSRITENRKKPLVFYTWEQILEIRAVRDLNDRNISLETRRRIIEFLDNSKIDNRLRDKLLVAVGEDVFWVNRDWSDLGKKMKRVVSSKFDTIQFSFVVIPGVQDIIEQVWEVAEKSQVVDLNEFKRRAKAKPA
ncbi:MerR family transcriptional regulator [Myxosarcina sp. GI1]|uniref:MerR family transcriptional regulator n=1 Tax=Myxosarcina sp. GI1 TaxID=1541065 RepID=UPI00055ECB8B|nr:MerR family transcriptional regulator [Myxosarcina sp. GI1]